MENEKNRAYVIVHVESGKFYVFDGGYGHVKALADADFFSVESDTTNQVDIMNVRAFEQWLVEDNVPRDSNGQRLDNYRWATSNEWREAEDTAPSDFAGPWAVKKIVLDTEFVY